MSWLFIWLVFGPRMGAHAAPVICDPDLAERLVVDARIDVTRVPVTHPWLLPGLARRSADAATVDAVDRLCQSGDDLFVKRVEATEQPGFKAYTLVLSRSREEPDSCSIIYERIPLSIGVGQGPPVYHLRGTLPAERFPAEDCEEPIEWREERLLDSEGDIVRMVLVLDWRGEELIHSHIALRAASRQGWSEVVLLSPAPARSIDPNAAGPALEMAEDLREGRVFISLSHDRVFSRERGKRICRPIGGQVVWQLDLQTLDLGKLEVSRSEGREALTQLARAGLWQLAGDDGYLLLLAQDDEEDQLLSQDRDEQRNLLQARLRRLQKRDPEPLYVLASSDFPDLNAGFLVIAPGPWPDEAQAREARGRWTRSAGASVKRAWQAIDPCADAFEQNATDR